VHLDRLRFLVLGAGAVGGYFGGRLVEANADVTFLVRPARAAALGERGLVIESPLGDLRLPVRVATADTLSGNFDTVLLTAKAYDLEPAIAAIRPAVGLETAILPLLNGLEHLDRLDAAFGPEHVLGGVAYIAATLTAEGSIHHLNRVHAMVFGERSGATSRRVETIARAFAATPVSASASEDIMLEMWEKLILISALAGMNCLMRGSVGDLLAADDGESLMLELLAECEAVAAVSGYPPLRASATMPPDIDRAAQQLQRVDAARPGSRLAHRRRSDPRRYAPARPYQRNRRAAAPDSGLPSPGP